MNLHKIRTTFVIGFLFLWSFNLIGQSGRDLFEPSATVTKLAGDFAFTEGPAADEEGNVYFTDQPNNKIWIWTTDGELTLFTNQSGRSNGLYVDQQGRLVACADMDNDLWRYNHDTVPEILVADYQGKALNGPNDLWIRGDGGIYFTDPLYKRSYWTRDPAMQQKGQYVYFFDPENETPPTPVDRDFVRPNGVVGNPNKNLLYIADIGDDKIYSYRMKKNGQLKRKKVFAEMGADGMTIDEQGNVYLAGKGVTIFNPKGEKIGHIPVPEPWTANICFGGKNRDQLFITASTGLYVLKMNVKGMRRF